MKKFIIAVSIAAITALQAAAFAEGGGGWITISDWAVDYVNAYRDTGLMPPYLKNYEITDYTADITRVQFCELTEPILKDKGYLDKDSYAASFTDCDNYAVAVLADVGIITGTSDTTFEPDRTITREEAAVILARLMDHTDTYHYEITDSIYHYHDERDFSNWAKESIYAVYNAKIMSGTGDNYFSPKSTYTIEQAIKVAYDLNNMIDPVPEETAEVKDPPEEQPSETFAPSAESAGDSGTEKAPVKKPDDMALPYGDDLSVPSDADIDKNLIGLSTFEGLRYNMTWDEAEELVESQYGFVREKDGAKSVTYNIGTGKYMLLRFSLADGEYYLTDAMRIGGNTTRTYDWNEDGSIILYNNENAGVDHQASGGGGKAEVSK